MPSYLDISLGLIRHLHDELGLRVDHVLKDLVVDTRTTDVGIWLRDVAQNYSHCAKVIGVRDEQVLLALSKKLVKDTRVDKGVVQITVTRWVPLALVAVRSLGAGE